MSYRRLFISCIAVAALSGPAAAQSWLPAKSKTQNMIGLERSDVRACLGRPDSQDQMRNREIWYYARPLPTRASSTLIERTRAAGPDDPPRMRTITTVEEVPASTLVKDTCMLRVEFDSEGVASVHALMDGSSSMRDSRCASIVPTCYGD